MRVLQISALAAVAFFTGLLGCSGDGQGCGGMDTNCSQENPEGCHYPPGQN